MALVELRQGFCDRCGADLLLHVYWPMATMLRRLVKAGGLQEFDTDDLAVLFDQAAEVDAYEADDGGELAAVRSMARTTGGLFVDTRTESVVSCPKCGALVGLVARQRTG